MRTGIITTILAILIFNVNAHPNHNETELGVVFKEVNDLGFQLKSGTERAKWRLTVWSKMGNKSRLLFEDDEFHQLHERDLEIRFGREWIARIAHPLYFRIGAEMSYAYNNVRQTAIDTDKFNAIPLSKTTTHRPAVNLVVGLSWKLGRHLVLNGEVSPRLEFMYDRSSNSDDNFSIHNSLHCIESTVDAKAVSLGVGFVF